MNPANQNDDLLQSSPSLVKGLSLMDTVLLLVGGVIGSGIFLTAGQVATSLRRPDLFILVWVAGGAISLLACFAVAELGGMYPQAGGQYVFLREAYGKLPAFLYGWMIFAVVQTGTIAALAVGFAQYMAAAFPVLLPLSKPVALASIAVLTATNIVGLRRGAVLVNVATWMKFAAMAALAILGLTLGKGDWSHFRAAAGEAPVAPAALMTAFGVALISVFFAYDGWIYITWVASEVKDASRNVPRALLIGVSAVVVIYVTMNVVYLFALPIESIIRTDAVVRDAAAAMFSSRFALWLSLMVALSAFGAMSSAILCTARIFYAMSKDGVFFASMARVHPRFRTPALSLVAQGLWSAALAWIGLYDQLLTYAIFMMIVTYIATVGALFVLRRKAPEVPRPYRCTGYPLLPAIYMVIASLWTFNTLVERPRESLSGLGIVLLGIPGYIYWTRRRRRSPQTG